MNNKKIKIQKDFDAVKYMREQRDKLSEELSKMNESEIIEFFKNLSMLQKIKPSA